MGVYQSQDTQFLCLLILVADQRYQQQYDPEFKDQALQEDASELRTEEAKNLLGGHLIPLLGLGFQNKNLQESQSLARTARVGVVLQEVNGSATVERKEPKRIRDDRATPIQMASFSG